MKCVCKYVFNKQNKFSFVNYVINDIMKKCMFSVNNHYFNYIEIFNGEGDEVICSENKLNDCINNLERSFLITMWRGNEAIDLLFDFSDDKYDVFDVILDGLKYNVANQIINNISTVVFENRQLLIGIIVDKKDLLSDICFKYNDILCLDFIFNFKSPIRKEVNKIIDYNICLCDFLDTYRRIDDGLGNIYICNFSTKGHILIEIFNYK